VPDENRDADETNPDDLIGPGEAARLLGIDASRLRQADMDALLCPIRTVTGRRCYVRRAIEAFAAQRDARRASR
jgi:hypothetical protein